VPKVTLINHVSLIVDDLEAAAAFYEKELGLEPLPAYKFDYPAAFFKVNETQQLHVTEWEDTPSFRGHLCVRVDDWGAAFKRFRELGIIDILPWGKVRKLPDGTYQMFIRDPSGNLIEISAPPGSTVDDSIFQTDELCQTEVAPYVSNRNDARGLQSDDASLYHSDDARQ
jgi:catechol 2,3-dioxygenase-like lactoylglutathione lyase family enzyme